MSMVCQCSILNIAAYSIPTQMS